MKLIIKLNGSRVELPDDFSDITMNKLISVVKLVETNMPESYKQSIYGKKKDNEATIPITPMDEAKYNDFKVEYLSCISGVSADLFRTITPHKRGDIVVDVHWLYERCSKFLSMPDQDDITKDLKVIDVGGKKYYRAPITKDMFGRDVYAGNMDYATWAAGQTILSIIDDVVAGEYRNDYIITLAAVMYREKSNRIDGYFGREVEEIRPYIASEAEQRAAIFRNASASDIISAYFFLSNCLTKWRQDTESSLTATIERHQNPSRSRSLVNLIKRKYVDLEIGLYLATKWLKAGFSIGAIRLRWNQFFSRSQ